MRVVVQRVTEGSVTIDGRVSATIGRGFVVLLGIRKGDTAGAAEFLAEKCVNLRVFEDVAGKMNMSLNDVGGSMLIVSQFTLYADARKGNRPGFADAAASAEAEPLYDHFVTSVQKMLGPDRVATGVFQSMMQVRMVNDGPVTILMESK